MLLIEKFLEENESLKQSEELISALTFIAQLPSDSINDVELTSKVMFFILSHLFEDDFYTNYLEQLEYLKKSGTLIIQSSTVSYKICINDRDLFEIVYLTILKYIRLRPDDNESSIIFFQNIFNIVVKSSKLLRSEFLHVLRMVEIVLNKRDDILTADLCVLFLKFLNKIASSPLTGFKHYSHSISRIILKRITPDQRTSLTQLHYIPIKGVDLSDLLRLIKDSEIIFLTEELNNRVIRSFYNNTDSRDGSFYYDRILSVYDFEEFSQKIWPSYVDYLKCECEGEFYQSILKYWIPISVKHYKSSLYKFAKTHEINFELKAHILLELKKRGHYDKTEFDLDAFKFVQYSATSKIGLKIFCTFLKKSVFPDSFNLNAIKFYLKYHVYNELSIDVMKFLKTLLSQVFLVSHMILRKCFDNNETIVLYENFFIYICQFCENRIRGQNCEMSAQILKLVWDCATGSTNDLLTNYKIDRDNIYDDGNNLFYIRLVESGLWQNSIVNKNIVKKIETVFTNDYTFCPTLLELTVKRYVNFLNISNLDNIIPLVQKVSKSVCLQNSEILRVYTSFCFNYGKTKNVSFSTCLDNLIKLFREKLGTLDTEDLYLCVLILDVLITYKNCEPDTDLVNLTELSLNYIDEIFDDYVELDVKTTKVLEAFINNVIECLIISQKNWQKFNKKQVLNQLCKIIQRSNMKKPVSMSINVVQQFGVLMEEIDEDKEMKLQLLNNTLHSLYDAPTKLNVKIRRNPEFRLVIHALILSDHNPSKFYLCWSVEFMLDVLLDQNSSDSTLSSTLHSLEVLVSDNSIHQYTLKFIPNIIHHCVTLFNSTSWIVRNANLQLLKALIERFLGVSLHSEIGIRPKTIQDLFLLFPEVIFTFYKTLSLPILNDSALIVLLFFSESQIKNNILINHNLQQVINNFRFLIVDIIKTYPYMFGALAVKTFTALCLEHDIPIAICDISNFICQNFTSLQTNIFANFIYLLQELLYKYNLTTNQNNRQIENAISNLTRFLRQFGCFYFNLLSIQIETIQEAADKILVLLGSKVTYETRIWLNNYMPFVINNLHGQELDTFLDKILFIDIPDFLQVTILNILVERFANCLKSNSIINILIRKLTELDSSNKLLIIAYSKTILLFYELIKNFTFSDAIIYKIRLDYGTDDIYKILVYVLAIANIKDKTKPDLDFLSKSLGKYKCFTDNEEILRDISITITPLYMCCSELQRYDLLKLVFYLLLNESTSIEMCRFVTTITNIQCSSILIALEHLLDYKNLKRIFQNDQLSLKILLEFLCFVNTSELFSQSETYYLIERDFSIPTEYVKSIIIKTLFVITG